jgi:hypothetical protein
MPGNPLTVEEIPYSWERQAGKSHSKHFAPVRRSPKWDQRDVEKKMMIVELTLIQDAEGQKREIRFQTFHPHEPGKFDMVEAIVIGHVWGRELDQGHTEKEKEEKCDGNKSFLHQGMLPGVINNRLRECQSF